MRGTVVQVTDGTLGSVHQEVVSVDVAAQQLFPFADLDKKMVVSLPLDELGC